MQEFRCEVVGADGRVEIRIERAESVEVLKAELERWGLQVRSIRPVEESAAKPSGRLSSDELEAFNRQIMMAARTGAPLVPALKALSRDLKRGRLKLTLDSMTTDLKAGKSLAETLAAHAGQFPPLYAAMADAAAASGNLHGMVEVLNQLVTSVAGLRRRVVSAVVYPIVVLCTAAGVLAFVSLGVVRQFLVLDFGADRPPSALVVGAMFAGMLPVALVCLGVVVLMLVGLFPPGRRLLSALATRLPFYGKMIRAQRAFVFCRTLALLFRAGVPMRQALRVVREVTPARSQRRALDEVLQRIQEGRPLSEAMEWDFPASLVWAVSVAESRADLPEGLYQASEYYREEAERRGQFLMEVLPAFLVVCAGVMASGVVIPVFAVLRAMMTSTFSGY